MPADPRANAKPASAQLTPGNLVKQAKARVAENRKRIKALRAELRAIETETNQLARLVEAAVPKKPRTRARDVRPIPN